MGGGRDCAGVGMNEIGDVTISIIRQRGAGDLGVCIRVPSRARQNLQQQEVTSRLISTRH